MIPLLRRHPHLHLWLLVLPVLSLALSYPAVFRSVIGLWPQAQNLIVSVTYAWVLVYVAVAILLLVIEFFSITMRFCRRQFSAIVGCMIALSGLYLMYCAQDPCRDYRFYSYDYIWNTGLGYLQYAPTIGGYITLVVVNVICGGLCLASILRYTRDSYTDSRDDVVMERKFDVARSGASVFVHSIKNQLLANRVLEKHIYAELDKPAPDLAYVRTCVDQLHGSNELLIDRSEELYRTVKSKRSSVVPVSLETLWSTTRNRLQKKYPDGLFTVDLSPETQVLADVSYLSEALYNLLTNAWEANLEAGRGSKPVLLQSHRERLYTVLEVRDEGPGILKRDMKKIFEPFYSSKNSNYSWGMGLYHVGPSSRRTWERTGGKSNLGGARLLHPAARYDHRFGEGWTGMAIRVLNAMTSSCSATILKENAWKRRRTCRRWERPQRRGNRAQWRTKSPSDVIQMDVEMETTTAGIRATEHILDRHPDACHPFPDRPRNGEHILMSMGAGAVDYIVKGCPEAELL
jgi:hypothetical protein